jgi:hypothetical protein
MYNNDQREQFIETTIQTYNKQVSARKAFNRVEEFEQQAQRDIATFSKV